MQKIIEKIAKFTNSKWMKILTNGFMNVAAISICGSIFSLIKSFPIPAYQNFLVSSGLGEILGIPVSICSDLMAVYVTLSMGYTVAKAYNQKNPFAASIVALGTFFVLTPFVAQSASIDPATGERVISTVTGAISTSILGARGIFLAMICGLFGARLYIYFVEKDIKIKLPDSVPDNVAGMFEMMIPGGLTFLVFLVIRYVFSITSFGTAQQFIYTLLQTPLMAVGGGLGGALVYNTVAKLLWCFGVHGGMVTYSALAPVISTAAAANASAYAASTAIPYPEWAFAMIMMDVTVLPLTLAMLLTAKSEQYKTLAKISLPTSLFNISEPLVFGIPIIMNPIIDIPFVLLPPVNLLLTLLATKIGILHAPVGTQVASVMPTPLSLAFATAHWTGAVWAVLLIVMNTLVFIPFFKIVDAKAVKEEQQAQVQG